MTPKAKMGTAIGATLAAGGVAVMSLLMSSSTFVPPPGSLTDCGLNNGTFQLQADIPVTLAEAQTKGKLRWGPCYGVSDGTNGCHSGQQAFGSPCTVSEADGILPTMWQEVHGGGDPTWQDAQDMGLILGLASQIERDNCNKVGPCTPANAYVITRDNDTTWATGRGAAGSCPAFKPTEKSCGMQTAWNCFWSHAIYVDNRAPHCLGAAPPCPPGEFCHAPCPTCPPPVTCAPLPTTDRLYVNAQTQCESPLWAAEKLGPNGAVKHTRLCGTFRFVKELKVCQ